MTCIIGTPQGIWSDRIITANTWERCDPIRKCVANQSFVVGFAGSLEGIIAALELAATEESLPALAAATTKVTGLAVRRGKLFVLELGKVWPRPRKCAYYAVGSGGTLAMSFLSGRSSASAEDILAAHRYVAKARDDCGRGVDFLETP